MLSGDSITMKNTGNPDNASHNSAHCSHSGLDGLNKSDKAVCSLAAAQPKARPLFPQKLSLSERYKWAGQQRTLKEWFIA